MDRTRPPACPSRFRFRSRRRTSRGAFRASSSCRMGIPGARCRAREPRTPSRSACIGIRRWASKSPDGIVDRKSTLLPLRPPRSPRLRAPLASGEEGAQKLPVVLPIPIAGQRRRRYSLVEDEDCRCMHGEIPEQQLHRGERSPPFGTDSLLSGNLLDEAPIRGRIGHDDERSPGSAGGIRDLGQAVDGQGHVGRPEKDDETSVLDEGAREVAVGEAVRGRADRWRLDGSAHDLAVSPQLRALRPLRSGAKEDRTCRRLRRFERNPDTELAGRQVKALPAIDTGRRPQNLTARAPRLEQAVHFPRAAAGREERCPGSSLAGDAGNLWTGGSAEALRSRRATKRRSGYRDGRTRAGTIRSRSGAVNFRGWCERKPRAHGLAHMRERSRPCPARMLPGFRQCRNKTAVRDPTLTAIGK